MSAHSDTVSCAISIHAPPRGATGRRLNVVFEPISIHAPPRGATEFFRCWRAFWCISIHAPPRGATVSPAERSIHMEISIHAPPRGATYRLELDSFAGLFQFTPLREGRPATSTCSAPQSLFQFTPLREGRRNLLPRVRLVIISIHAPPRGAPLEVFAQDVEFLISIHAPPRGATGWRRHEAENRHISIHAPPRGATRRAAPAGRAGNFNSRPSARGDGKRYAISANLLFNPYKSAWLNNSATQFVEIILVIFHRIIA